MTTTTRNLALIGIVLGLVACGRDGKAPEAQQTPLAGEAGPALAPAPIPDDPEAVLITVNGKSLTRGDLDQQVQQRLLPIRGRIPPNQIPAARREIATKTVEQFVLRSLMLQEADRRGILVTPEDEQKALHLIDQRLSSSGRTNVTALGLMKESALGEDMMKQELYAAIRIEKLIALEMSNRVDVSEQEITDFIDENRDKLLVPEAVKLSEIVIAVSTNAPTDAVSEARRTIEAIAEELRAGGDFAKIATERSDGPTASNGGVLGVMVREQLPEHYAAVAMTLEAGVPSPIIETDDGFHIVRVDERRQEELVPQEYIEGELKRRKRTTLVSEYLSGLREKAQITYGQGVMPVQE